MTQVTDMLFHLGGAPVMPGVPMQINTEYWFVDCSIGTDGNDGRSASSPLATLAAAITKMKARIDWAVSPWARRDVLVVAPGTYAENLTSLPYGCTIFGLGFDLRDAQVGVKIKPACGAPVDVDAMINTALYNLCFEAAASTRAFDAAICNNNLFHNCRFSGPAEDTTATGFYTLDATGNRFLFCEFDCCDVGLDAQYADAGDGFNHNWLYECRFTQCDTAGLRTNTNLVGPSSVVERSIFVGAGQTMAIGIDDNAGILDLVACHITATDPVQGCRSANGCYGNGGLLNGSGE
jgi:hypothetical protein